MARKKRLTQADQRLLRHPPTPKTWVCKCGIANSGRNQQCFVCGKCKPQKPKLLWPAYLAACEAVGIQPGTPWPVREEPTEPAAQKKPVRRKGRA